MPQHPYYEPSNGFIERHRLEIDEAEIWCELTGTDGRTLTYNKDTGYIMLESGPDKLDWPIFQGYLPDETALESVIKWTNW